MAAIRVTAKTKEAEDFVKALAAALSEAELDKVVDKVALKALGWLIEGTPKGHTGRLRNGWTIAKPREAQRILANMTTIETSFGPRLLLDMLATGTGIYGPQGKPVVSPYGRMMYVPLSRRAYFGYRPGMRYGVDFVMAKEVRGIKPLKRRKVIENVEPRVANLLESEVAKHLSSRVGI